MNSEQMGQQTTTASHPDRLSRGQAAPRFVLGQVMLMVALTGCNRRIEPDYSQLDLARVSGRVTLDDVPLYGAVVQFESEDLTYSYGTTDELGGYTLMFNSRKEGVLTGPKTVRISSASHGEEADEREAGGEGEEDQPEAETVPECYNRESKLKVTVASGSQTFNFSLQSDCSTTGLEE